MKRFLMGVVVTISIYGQVYGFENKCNRIKEKLSSDIVLVLVQYRGIDGKGYLHDICGTTDSFGSMDVKYYGFIEIYDLLGGKFSILKDSGISWENRSTPIKNYLKQNSITTTYMTPIMDSKKKTYNGIILVGYKDDGLVDRKETRLINLTQNLTEDILEVQTKKYGDMSFGHSYANEGLEVCGDTEGWDFGQCIFSRVIIGTLDEAMKQYPKSTLLIAIFSAMIFFFGRRVDVQYLLSRFKRCNKMQNPETAYLMIMTLWDRDLNCIVIESLVAINIDEISSQTAARDRLENIIYKYRNKSIDKARDMIDEALLVKVNHEIHEIYESWLATLVNVWDKYKDKECWFLSRQFHQALDDNFEIFREEVKRKISI